MVDLILALNVLHEACLSLTPSSFGAVNRLWFVSTINPKSPPPPARDTLATDYVSVSYNTIEQAWVSCANKHATF